MARDTGENAQALRKILDMTRMMAIVILSIHCYYYCYRAFAHWKWVWEFSDKLLDNIVNTGLFNSFHTSKFIALGLLAVSLLGVRGKKSEQLNYRTGLAYLIGGLIGYFISGLLFFAPFSLELVAMVYIALTGVGFILILTGSTLITRILKDRLSDDIFNHENETFPQEERLLENEYSVNLPTIYQFKSKERKSWINIIQPFSGVLIAGVPGAGKSYFFVRHVITQHIEKGFALFCYDFKFPDLSVLVYNTWLKNKHQYHNSACYFINFDDLSRSHRCNPLDPLSMTDITDATESARTILFGLNREWLKKNGDFFVESAVNILTAIIWYLRKYQNGKYCTLPHAIELMQTEYVKLFSILQTEPEIEVLIDPFVKAFLSNVSPQLEGQVASAKIALARISSPQLYYVLTGNDFTLDINNPDEPKLVCMGNNPQKIQIYGAILSLYVNRLIKLVNQKGKLKSSLIFDEFPTLTLTGMDVLLATARSNKVATFLALQSVSQLRKDYGREQADVIIEVVGNIISGQATGELAKQLSERIGKIMQDRQSLSINSGDTSISKSKQLDYAVPPSTISSLSSGTVVGLVADTPNQKIQLKAFHSAIQNDHEALKKEDESHVPIPIIRQVDNDMVQQNFLQIKEEVKSIVENEINRMMRDPELAHLVLEAP